MQFSEEWLNVPRFSPPLFLIRRSPECGSFLSLTPLLPDGTLDLFLLPCPFTQSPFFPRLSWLATPFPDE